MSTRYHQIKDVYPHLKNPEKYTGTRPITCRSGWEISFVIKYLDITPNVISWKSENTIIKYIDINTNTTHRYFIDFTLIIKDINGNYKEIWIEINQDGKKKEFKAKVAVQDKNNDLAILKVDNEIFPKPVFGFKTLTTDVGSSVYAMGYPLLSVLGDEIKITDGIISSKTGYQGDISTYQISAPIQPGNSGGPLFDKKGYLIGITNAGIPGAENIGYAIKTSYLQNLIELLSDKVELPTISKLENSAFTDQIKQFSKYVTIIKTR